MKVEASAELEAALRRRGVILSACCWCHEYLGETDALGAEGGFSGGVCRDCNDRMILGDSKRVIEEHDEAVLRAETFAHGAMVTAAIIFAMVAFGLFVALLLGASPAHASGPAHCLVPECVAPRHHKHKLHCEDVLDCVTLPPPRPCLDVDVYYFACDRKLAEVFVGHPKPVYLCATQDGKTRKVRRNKMVNVLDAVLEAETLNRTVCP